MLRFDAMRAALIFACATHDATSFCLLRALFAMPLMLSFRRRYYADADDMMLLIFAADAADV